MISLAGAAFAVIKAIIILYTYLTYPIYRLLQYNKGSQERHVRATLVQRSNSEVTYRCVYKPCKAREEVLAYPDKIDNLSKLFRFIVKKYGQRAAMGSRQILREEVERQPDGKVFNKVVQGPYQWISYNDASELADNFGKGIRELGVRPLDKVCIYADTRPEWLLSAIGCFKNRIAICTIYTNLGEDGIIHGITQTQVSTVITSMELMPKLLKVRHQIPSVNKIIFFENPTKNPHVADEISFYSWKNVVNLGKKSSIASAYPEAGDTAIVMYTSGSTGVPKGVVLTHKNMVSAIMSLVTVASYALNQITEEDSYIAFLPLAHVLEMLAEHVMLLIGVKIGYSNPNTLTDKGTMIRTGDQGDATLLKPTVMAAVPLIVDRIYKGIKNNISDQSAFKQLLVNFCFQYRTKWTKRGFRTPLMDRLIFTKMRAAIGGRLRVLLSGGAPLADDAHIFIRNALCCDVMEGYGLTETCSTATISDPKNLSTGNVGPPLVGVDLKITNWLEGGYTVNDAMGPRGEILVGGDHVSPGYYNMSPSSSDEFFQSEGKHFFRTGDIGQILPDGSVKIIDRKKDLVKLQAGEYVSLGKVESNLKINPLVDNVCVFGNSKHSFTIALVVPDDDRLQKLAESMNRSGMKRTALCNDSAIVNEVLNQLIKQGKATRLEKFEIPKKIRLIPEPWTPESGLVTAAFKLRRREIQKRFQDLIDEMYGDETSAKESKLHQISPDRNNNPKILPV